MLKISRFLFSKNKLLMIFFKQDLGKSTYKPARESSHGIDLLIANCTNYLFVFDNFTVSSRHF